MQGVYPAQAQLEDESGPVGNDIYFGWPGDVLNANYVNNQSGGNHGYVRGLYNGTHGGFAFDSDCFKFLVNEGDLMSWYGDGEPARNATATAQFPQPIIYDAEPAGISNFIFGANARKNIGVCVGGTNVGASCTSNAQCTGGGACNLVTGHPTLNGLAPAVTTSFFQWRASYTGMLEVCYYDASVPLGLGTPGNGNWAGSLDANCGPLRAAGPGTTTTDVSVVKTIIDGPDPVEGQTGTFLQYQIAITNSSSDIAQEVHLIDVLDPNLSFISLTGRFPRRSASARRIGGNTTCITTDGFQFFDRVAERRDRRCADRLHQHVDGARSRDHVPPDRSGQQLHRRRDRHHEHRDDLHGVHRPRPEQRLVQRDVHDYRRRHLPPLLCDAGRPASRDRSVPQTRHVQCGHLRVHGPWTATTAMRARRTAATPTTGCLNDSGPIGGQCEDFNDCTIERVRSGHRTLRLPAGTCGSRAASTG